MILVQMVMMTSLMNKRERERERERKITVCVWREKEEATQKQRQRSNIALKKKYKKKGKKKDHAFFPFQTCSFPNVFKRLDAPTNTNITFYDYIYNKIITFAGAAMMLYQLFGSSFFFT